MSNGLRGGTHGQEGMRVAIVRGDIEIVAEASRGDEVLPAALDAFPDVALPDVEMPGDQA
jgi:DNA-binding NarL/FixJ family response regulator